MTHVLIAGISTRAAAASAARAGFRVTALDAYADRDQEPGGRAMSLPRDFGQPFTAAAAASIASRVSAEAVSFLSNFENDPDAVGMLCAGRSLWGNPPGVLRQVRDPFRVTEAFRAHAIPVPRLRHAANPDDPDSSPHSYQSRDEHQSAGVNDSTGCDWLIKPLASGGGHGIRPWSGERVRPGFFLQERIDGAPGSILFLASAGRAVPLAVTRQLIGDAAFGATGFRYCGNIVGPGPGLAGDESAIWRQASRLADVAARHFGLVGINCVDVVSRDGQLYPVEINPRWSASVELVEQACGLNGFSAHADACAGAILPSRIPAPRCAAGKAIVFARRDVRIPDTDAWLDDPGIRDVPHQGEFIAAGSPVCTVVVEADTTAGCYDALVARALRLYDELERAPDIDQRRR